MNSLINRSTIKALGFGLFLSLSLAPLSALAETSDAPPGADPLASLLSEIEQILEKEEVPGAGIAIVANHEHIWTGGIGLADSESRLKANEDTLWRIGSISKMFVSLATLKLQEQGIIDLQDKLVDHAPEIPFENRWRDTNPIRLLHLLEHTSGFDDFHMNEYALSSPDISLKEGLEYNPRSRRSRWKPGTFMSYSNAGPPMAAYVVEKAAGQDYEDFVAENFFAPLGMPKTSFRLTPEVESLLAKSQERQSSEDYWHIIMRPSGSINSSAREMSHFLAFLVGRGEYQGQKLLSEASLERMETPSSTLAVRSSLSFGYGLCNYTSAISGFEWQGHGGAAQGYLANLAYLPEQGCGFVILTTKSGRALSQIGRKIASYLTKDIPKPTYPEVIDANKEDLERYAGVYRPATSRQQLSYGLERLGTMKLEAKDGYLEGRNGFGKKLKYRQTHNDLFYHDGKAMPTVIRFEDDRGGEYFQQGVDRTWRRISPLGAAMEKIAIVVCLFAAVSSVVMLLVYATGRLFGKFKDTQYWTHRLAPGIAIISLLAMIAMQMLIASEDISDLGRFTWMGLGAYLLGWTFVVFAVIGLIKTIQSYLKRYSIQPILKAFLLLIGLSNITTATYFLYWNPWLPLWIH